jgi:hypothetical protein
MPEYIQRTLSQLETEFYKCGMNPEGYMFSCVFCGEFFRTTRLRKDHMMECALEHTDDEYDEDFMLDEDTSVADELYDNNVYLETIKDFIRSNELRDFVSHNGDQIQEYIKRRLKHNGINTPKNRLIFKIYDFFFVVPNSEREVAKKEWTAEILNLMTFDP